MEELLARCGVRPSTLSDAEREALDQRGFVVLSERLDGRDLERARAAFERGVGPEPVVGGKQGGTRHADEGLVDEPDFAFALAHPSVLAAAAHVLGRPFRVMMLGARDPMPGFGAQGLHADWMPRAKQDPFGVATMLWLLDDFTPENGATRVVPGSHRMPGMVPRALSQPDSSHPEEEVVTARAGSVLFFNGHLWHAGGRNGSDGPRRVLQGQFVADALAPPSMGVKSLPPHFAAEVRELLGVSEQA